MNCPVCASPLAAAEAEGAGLIYQCLTCGQCSRSTESGHLEVILLRSLPCPLHSRILDVFMARREAFAAVAQVAPQACPVCSLDFQPIGVLPQDHISCDRCEARLVRTAAGFREVDPTSRARVFMRLGDYSGPRGEA